MELIEVERAQIERLRDQRRREPALTIVPGFSARLAEEAAPYLLRETGPDEVSQEDAGYVLAVQRPHGSHVHVTVVELFLSAAYQTRFDDALDLIRERLRPSAYLVRTDDCRLNAALLSRGLQVEPAALVMLPEESGEAAQDRTLPALGAAAIIELSVEHMPGLRKLLENGTGSQHLPDGDHHDSGDEHALVDDLESLARRGGNWVVLVDRRPVAVIARLDGGDGSHELLDLVVARADEDVLAWALRSCTEALRKEGRRPGAVIDTGEPARRRTFRKAGYYSAAAYLVFYDPETGRPSVGTMTAQDLHDLLEGPEPVRLVDVLGEKHWRAGHLPGSEWLDFRGLAREARRRFKPDEPIVLYCDGFT
jgi:Rhodanese-like domain